MKDLLLVVIVVFDVVELNDVGVLSQTPEGIFLVVLAMKPHYSFHSNWTPVERAFKHRPEHSFSQKFNCWIDFYQIDGAEARCE